MKEPVKINGEMQSELFKSVCERTFQEFMLHAHVGVALALLCFFILWSQYFHLILVLMVSFYIIALCAFLNTIRRSVGFLPLTLIGCYSLRTSLIVLKAISAYFILKMANDSSLDMTTTDLKVFVGAIVLAIFLEYFNYRFDPIQVWEIK